MFFIDQYIYKVMIGSLRNFAKTKLAGVLVFIIIIPFVFWGMGSMFNSGNTNNIAKINKTNVSTQDFIDYLNTSGVNRKTIQEKMNEGILEELLSDRKSTRLNSSHVCHLVCRLLLEKKNFFNDTATTEIYTQFIFPYTTLFRSRLSKYFWCKQKNNSRENE